MRADRPRLDSFALTLRGPRQAGLFSVAFSPDGRHLAAGGMDKSVHVWESLPQE